MRTCCLLAVAFAAMSLAGCFSGLGGAAANQKVTNDLKQLGMAYHNFHDSKNRGPESAAEWDQMASSAEDKALIAAVASGEYVFYWNVRLANLTAGTGFTVLGYHKDVPSNGGMVLMADASVRTMTAQEFAAAPKADSFTGKK